MTQASASALSAFGSAMCVLLEAAIELEAMKVANNEREQDGKALAYDDSAFFTLQQNMIGRFRSCIEGCIRGRK